MQNPENTAHKENSYGNILLKATFSFTSKIKENTVPLAKTWLWENKSYCSEEQNMKNYVQK